MSGSSDTVTGRAAQRAEVLRRVDAIAASAPLHEGLQRVAVAKAVADMVIFEPGLVLDAETRQDLVDRFFRAPPASTQ